MENATEILIPWNLIDKEYKHARIDENGRMHAYTHESYASLKLRIWTTEGDYTEITGLVTGYILELDWKTFEATRPAETKKVYYTQKDFDNGEHAPIGSTCILLNEQGFEFEYGKNAIGKEVIVLSRALPCSGSVSVQAVEHEGVCYCFRSSVLKPIDNRTDEEKLIDDVKDFLIEIDVDHIFTHKYSALDIATDLVMSGKFTITKKGD